MDLCLPTYFRNDGYLRNGSLVTLRMEVQSTNHIWKVTTLKSRTTGLCNRNVVVSACCGGRNGEPCPAEVWLPLGKPDIIRRNQTYFGIIPVKLAKSSRRATKAPGRPP